ncbi:MAG: hypothetical protein RDA78_22535 [Roseibium sp.]|uniref:hypothetical protein n=1 Tax=Roseibium sp. TaxID=1936156 RepID=UPI003D9C3A24
MAKIVVETAETKKKVADALRENDFQRAVVHYRENSATGQPFGTILNGDFKGSDHRILMQINPSDNDLASGGFVIGFTELAETIHDALNFDAQARALCDGPALGEVETADSGFSEPKGESFLDDPVAIMERKLRETQAFADALGSVVDILRADMSRYHAWLRRMQPPEE